MALHPDIWFECVLAKYPASEGTQTLRYAPRPYADAASWKEGRLLSISPITRAWTTTDGNWTIGHVTVRLRDDDGVLRAMLAAGTATEYFLNREGGIYMLSSAGRAAGLTPRTFFRGWISDAQAGEDRIVTITLSDVIGSAFSGFNLDKTIGVPITRRMFPLAPDESLRRIMPIILGEHSDGGAININGQSAEKGLTAPIYVGMCAIDGSDDLPEYVTPPQNLIATVVGEEGSRTVRYYVTALTAHGETLPSQVAELTNAPDTLSSENYVRLEWTRPEQHGTALKAYRLWGRDSESPLTYLAILNNDGTWVDPETTYDDTGAAIPMSGPSLTINTALATDKHYGEFIVAQGAVSVPAVFVSNLAANTTPQRVKAADDLYGDAILAPGRDGYPHEDGFKEKDGIRYTPIYVRGPWLQHHLNGSVTVATSVCGYDENGDQTGNMVDEAFPALQLFFNEFVLKNGGTGYRTGNWGPLETYANGDTILRATKFAEKQALTAQWLGNTGYKINMAISVPLSLREIVTRICVTFGCGFTADHHGRIFPVLINNTADPTAGRLYRERIEIKRLGTPTLAWDEIENRMVYHFQWDDDAVAFRAKNLEEENPESIAAHVPGGVINDGDRRGVRQRGERAMYYTADPLTARDVIQRELSRLRRRPRYQPIVTNLLGLEDDVDALVRWSHTAGLGPVGVGDYKTPGIVITHTINPNVNTRNEVEVELLVRDLSDVIISNGAPLALGSEADEDADTLGSEDNPPPEASQML